MTLSHRKARQYIEVGLDAPLPTETERQLLAHLATCAECTAYQEELVALDAKLAARLPQLWTPPPVSADRLATVTARVKAQRQRERVWRPFRLAGRAAVSGVLVVLLAVVVFWFLRPPETAVEEVNVTPTVVAVQPEDNQMIASLTSDYIVVHFEFSGGLSGLKLYHPACDGVALTPLAAELAQKLADEEAQPHCELIASNTLLFRPGEARRVLLVVRNEQSAAIAFRFQPQDATGMKRPFLQPFCPDSECPQYTLDEDGVWARFLTVQAPEGLEAGSSLTLQVDVEWETLFGSLRGG